MRTLAKILVCGLALSATGTQAKPSVDTRCIVASGGVAARCVREYAEADFFDGVLNCNAGVRARLDPAMLSTIEDLEHQSK
jgi:hypothetical protein